MLIIRTNNIFATSDYYLNFWLLNRYLTNRKTEDDGTMEVSYDDIMFMQALEEQKNIRKRFVEVSGIRKI